MKNFKRLTIFLVASTVLLFGFLLTRYFLTQKNNYESAIDYPEIAKDSVLRVVISTNPIDYFIYQGQPMGFQLEILEDFALEHNLTLETIVENDTEKGMQMLLNRECDILAQSAINTANRDLVVEFTVPLRQTKQVLVQRIPDEQLGSDTLIRDLSDLKLKTLYIQKGSANLNSLKNLASEIIQNFYVVEIDSMSPEQMIKNVSDGNFDYVVCNYNIAKISQSYYPNIDIKTDMSFPQNISWCVRPESEILLDTLNIWLGNYMKLDEYSRLVRKYINNNRILVDINSEFYSGNEGKISKYDNLIKKHSNLIGWDWRLIASLIYEESRFKVSTESWAGAYGIMQLLPTIYQKYTSSKYQGIESEIYAGINYLDYLDTRLASEITDSIERIKFVLASYNIGPGHIDDAISLTKKYKKKPASWQDVSYYLINLSNPKFYNDTLVKHGYFPGIYSVEFANSITNRYKHYVNIIPK